MPAPLFLALIALLPAHAGEPSFHDIAVTENYSLLRLPPETGPYVKWRSTEAGKPAVITYALATKALSPGIEYGDCKELEPISAFLKATKLPEAKFYAEVEAGLALWEKVSGVHFIRIKDIRAADLVIGMSKKQDSLHAKVGLKVSKVERELFSTLEKATLCLDRDENWTLEQDHRLVGDKKFLSLRLLITHEAGHVIGLNHPENEEQIMHYKVRSGRNGPAEGDRDGAQLLYGEPVGTE